MHDFLQKLLTLLNKCGIIYTTKGTQSNDKSVRLLKVIFRKCSLISLRNVLLLSFHDDISAKLYLRISEDSFAEINLYQDGGVAGGNY